MKIYNNITELIGNTPLLKLDGIKNHYSLEADIIAKLESFNPAGSAKDRAALEMILDAERKGLINKDSVIIEPTSGNTGIGLALVAGSRGYKVILTMPESMSIERRKLLQMYGATLVLTDKAEGMPGAIKKAKELAQSTPNSFIPDQFCNPANSAAHYKATGPEIWRDTDGKVDIFIATVGTGGTVSGVGKYLKEQNPNAEIVAVEPAYSAVLSGEAPGRHGIQGIGAGFIPEIYDSSVVDKIVKVTDEDAFKFAREVVKYENVPVGISSGAAICAAVKLAALTENKGKNIVALLVDSGERYLSTTLFD